jgi:hypothetical protein
MEEQFNAEELELIEYLKTEGYSHFKKVPNHGICSLRKFIFTTGIIVGLNPIGYYGRYCYSDYNEALNELKNWDGLGDPNGNWLKYKGEGGERENKGCEMCKANSNE